MSRDTDILIDALVDDLRPALAMKRSHGLALAAAAAIATVALVALAMGVRPDVVAGWIDMLFLFANGTFLLLGAAAATTAVTMASPQVGDRRQGWRWASAFAALLPLTALILLISRSGPDSAGWAAPGEAECVILGVGLGVVTAAALLAWLRRGAPASPERAGLLVGLAAGSVGIFAYAFHCPSDSIYHVGIWHSAVVMVSAALGRIAAPPLLRW